MTKLCPNCDISKKIFLTDFFCDDNCKTVYLMRCEKSAFFKGECKYPEFIGEMKSIMNGNPPNIKLKPVNANILIGRGDFFS